MKATLITALVATCAAAVHGGKYPAFPMQTCTSAGCTTEATSIVFDYRWKIEPAQYAANGLTISGNSVKLQLKDGNGPRVYLAASDSKYKMFKMVGKELTYDVETSELDCNMNGALYFIQMPENGAADGTGYCDANCVGGTCCPEMDIWEANKYATAMTNHVSGTDGGGCGINPFKAGQKNLYGAGSSFSVDTTKPFTVVTQFLTGSSGSVSEIRRIYKQNGKSVDGGSLTSSCNAAGMGEAMKGGSVLSFSLWSSGGLQWLDAGENGPCPTGSTSSSATLTFSNLRYGDIGTTTGSSGNTTQPTTQPLPTQTSTPAPTQTSTPAPTQTSTQAPTTQPTTLPSPTTQAPTRTPKPTRSPKPTQTQTSAPTATVAPPTETAAPEASTAPTSTDSPNQNTGSVGLWQRCGGIGYSGPTQCAEGKCTKYNDWYSQCVQA